MRITHSCALALGLGASLLAACSADSPSAPSIGRALVELAPANGKARICHRPAGGGAVLEIGRGGVADHLGHGDYISTLMVSHDAGQPLDGAHFTTIGGALAAARASRAAAGETQTGACRITIVISPGIYQGTIGTAGGAQEHFPLTVDIPDITLHGALAMTLDASGRATGAGSGGVESVLAPSEPLPFANDISTPIIIADGHPGGSAGNGLVVEGLVFQSGHDPVVDAGGQGILALRVTGLVIRGNRFEAGFTESVDLRASSADVANNHLSGTAGTCDLCLAGPGRFTATGNRLLAGGIPGIAVSPTVLLPVPGEIEQYVLPASAETWATIRNNEVRDHQRVPVGVGVRMDAIGVGAPNVHGTIHATVQDNFITDNRFGIIVHGAFPVAGTDLRGDVDLTLGGNSISGSCQTDLLVAFSRHQTGLGIDAKPRPFLLGSTFALTLNHNLDWDDAWYSNPEGFGNVLVVDGEVIPSGARSFYDAAGCPGT
jgi:hypothetical protein